VRARPEDYERILTPGYAWLFAMAQYAPASGGPPGRQQASGRMWRRLSRGSGHRPLRSWLLRAGFGATIATLNRAGIGPLRAEVSGQELRRAALSAIGEATARLGVEAAHVIFGHTHRAGPLAADDPEDWALPGGGRLWNSGSWVLERAWTRDGTASPYWPGGAVELDDPGGAPRHVRLLDGADAARLRSG
jgi:hypothetical protein